MRLSVQNLGPIAEADVTFGDLTILVGPQATGKSIFLQTLKLVRDHDDIGRALNVHGYFWNSTSSTADYQELFYGEGLGKLWHDATSVKFNESPITLASIAFFAGDIEHVFDPAEESVLYVPAQRVALFRKGWPRPFSDFDDGGPFVLRDFSESLRRFSDYFVQYDEDEPLFETQLEGIVPTVYQQWEVSVDLSQKRRR